MMRFPLALFSAFSAVFNAGRSSFVKPLNRVLATTGVCALVLVGCNSMSSNGGPEIDPVYGVAASPRVTDQQVNLPRGGGRAQVGRPYRIAGRLYTPREDPNYDRTGVASWYGDAFHGRLTANGEVYDMHTLSAAHPTLPLPSYVRVTNLSNDHSVVVRVNDRGPFAHNRIIDLSKRAADVLDFRRDGLARVRVEYIERAPLHGQDVAWLEASAQINGVPRNGADPNVMLASAPVPAPVAAPSQTALVATSDTAEPVQPTRESLLSTLFGAPTTPVATTVAPPPIQPSTPSAFAASPATGAPLDLTPRAPAVQAIVPRSAPVLAPQPAGVIPNAPVPGAAIGFMATDLETGFTQRNQSMIAQTVRIESAHRTAAGSALDAATHLALRSQTLARFAETQRLSALAMRADVTTDSASARTTLVQIGIFGDPANVARLRNELASLGDVITETVQSRGRTLTQVRLRASAPSQQAEQELLRTLVGRGYTDAYVTDAASG